MKPHSKRAAIGIIIVAILLVACLVVWSLSGPVARPTLVVKKFWENYQGQSMALLCVSNAGNASFFLQSSGHPDSSFAPGTHSPSYVVERKSTNTWVVETSAASLPLWFRLDAGETVEFRAPLPADGQVRRFVIPFKCSHLPGNGRAKARTMAIPLKKRPSRLDNIEQTWLKLLAWLGLDPKPKLRSPEFVINPKTRFAPMTQMDRERIFPPPDLASPYTPFAERYGIG